MYIYRLSIIPMTEGMKPKEVYFRFIGNAQRYAVKHYAERQYAEQGAGESAGFSWTSYYDKITSGDLGWVMYDIDRVELED